MMAERITDLKNKGVCSEQSDVEEDAINNLHLAVLQKSNLGPRKKLLVMGLGGLLCHRVCKRDVSDIPRSRYHDAFYGSILVYKRPYCEEFMKFCLEKFEVGIWSSAKEWYLDSALDCIMKGLKTKLLFAWDQVECTDSGFKALENKKKPIFFKEFKKLQKFSIQYSATNTLLIDDNPYKALLNPPRTAIFPNEYKTDQVGDAALGPGGDLRLYLEGLADANDVPSYVNEHPFGQPAITPLHSDWEFYSGVIRHFQKE